TSGDWKMTHVTAGEYCFVVNGLDIHDLAHASVTATARWDFDHSGNGTPGSLTIIEVNKGAVQCPTGFFIFTLTFDATNGSLTFADSGFDFTVMH
ncbi:MAG: hypothetical protein RJA49_2095, partial [Actinomycetota bacterium]